MNHDRFVVTTITCILIGLAVVIGAVVYLIDGYYTLTEHNFKEACAEVKGKAVWNGRYWECLR